MVKLAAAAAWGDGEEEEGEQKVHQREWKFIHLYFLPRVGICTNKQHVPQIQHWVLFLSHYRSIVYLLQENFKTVAAGEWQIRDSTV